MGKIRDLFKKIRASEQQQMYLSNFLNIPTSVTHVSMSSSANSSICVISESVSVASYAHYGSCFLPLAAAAAKLLQSCPTLRDPIDSSPPGSPVPGILQARTLEWVVISFSNA